MAYNSTVSINEEYNHSTSNGGFMASRVQSPESYLLDLALAEGQFGAAYIYEKHKRNFVWSNEALSLYCWNLTDMTLVYNFHIKHNYNILIRSSIFITSI